jgi:hypothetical protein
MAQSLVFSALVKFSQFLFWISNFFGQSTTENTFKSSRKYNAIAIVLVLHLLKLKGHSQLATDSGEILYAFLNLDRSLLWYF